MLMSYTERNLRNPLDKAEGTKKGQTVNFNKNSECMTVSKRTGPRYALDVKIKQIWAFKHLGSVLADDGL